MGTWKAGQSIIYTGIRHPTSVMKNVIPIVMAGGKDRKERRRNHNNKQSFQRQP
jgi:hypothetical protein